MKAYRMSLFLQRNCTWQLWLFNIEYFFPPSQNHYKQKILQCTFSVKNRLNHQASERVIHHACSIGFCDKDRHGGITPVSPISWAAVNLSLCYLWKRYITWGPDSLGHARMYGADSRAGCHPISWLMWSRTQPLICLIRAGDEAITLFAPPLVLSDGHTCGFRFCSQTGKWKQENPHSIYPISAVQIIFMGRHVVYTILSPL